MGTRTEPTGTGGWVGCTPSDREGCLTAELRAAIRAAVWALPPLNDEEMDALLAAVAAVRDKGRRDIAGEEAAAKRRDG